MASSLASSSAASCSAAATPSCRWATDEVPGMSGVSGERCSSHASATASSAEELALLGSLVSSAGTVARVVLPRHREGAETDRVHPRRELPGHADCGAARCAPRATLRPRRQLTS